MIRKKLKEHLLRKLIPPLNQDPSKFGDATIEKNTSTNTKINTITPKLPRKFTPLNTSTILTALNYNIVEDMKKVHTNILIFDLTRKAS